MNDVLPKPFTKEGLLHMLEKHLAHLKKPVAHANIGQASAMVPPSSVQQTMKDEESPSKSPVAGSNWNSPNNTITGVSPVASSVTDEYNMGHAAAAYGVQPLQMPGQVGMGFQTSPQMAMGLAQQQGQPSGHRRQISEISGGDDGGVQAKRQMFAPPMQPQTMNTMRPR